MKEVDFTSLPIFFLTTLFIFLGIFGRYVATALIFNFFVKRVFKSQYKNRKVQVRARRQRQNLIEISWSFLTSALFAFSGTVLLIAWQKGFTRIYLDIDTYTKSWLVVSIILVLFLHETYYYWLHR